jgi:hypothetical protein
LLNKYECKIYIISCSHSNAGTPLVHTEFWLTATGLENRGCIQLENGRKGGGARPVGQGAPVLASLTRTTCSDRLLPCAHHTLVLHNILEVHCPAANLVMVPPSSATMPHPSNTNLPFHRPPLFHCESCFCSRMGTRQPPSDHGLEVTCNSCKQLRRLPWVFESVPSSEAHQIFHLKMKSGFVLERKLQPPPQSDDCKNWLHRFCQWRRTNLTSRHDKQCRYSEK